VRRESLFTRLDAALEYSVMLVSAPAGHGILNQLRDLNLTILSTQAA